MVYWIPIIVLTMWKDKSSETTLIFPAKHSGSTAYKKCVLPCVYTCACTGLFWINDFDMSGSRLFPSGAAALPRYHTQRPSVSLRLQPESYPLRAGLINCKVNAKLDTR